MPKYIDASKIRLTAVGTVDKDGDILVSVRDVRKAIEQTPAADVAEVVRCKDCIYRIPLNEEYTYKENRGMYCCRYARLTSENGYCDDGVRKERK